MYEICQKLYKINQLSRSLNLSNLTGRIIGCSSLAFVPKCQPAGDKELIELEKFLNKSDKICVLTGAGISTESGIPDYRSEDVGLYARSNHRPVQYKEFCGSEQLRRRYWARNYVGWPRFEPFNYFVISFSNSNIAIHHDREKKQNEMKLIFVSGSLPSPPT